jgi:hypothetical protein
MKLVILLSAVFVVLGAWAANLPLDEENQSDVRHRSQRQSDKNVEAMKLYLLGQVCNVRHRSKRQSDKNVDALKLYLLGQVCNYGASYRKYLKVIFLKMTQVSKHQLCKLKMLRVRERKKQKKEREREREREKMEEFSFQTICIVKLDQLTINSSGRRQRRRRRPTSYSTSFFHETHAGQQTSSGKKTCCQGSQL